MELRHFIPLVALLLFGCQREQWDDCITSAGSMRQEERTLSGFHTVELDDRVDLLLEARTTNEVGVEAGLNLIGQVVTEVRDSVLYVRNENRCNWVRSFKPRMTIKVPIHAIRKLVLRGTGNVACADTLARDRFELEQWGAQGSADLLLNVTSCSIALHTGAGDVTMRGRCIDRAELFSGIMAPLDASAMITRRVSVNNSGVADIRCWAILDLDVQIRDVGDVYYRGAPNGLRADITGSGELIHQ